MTNTALPPFPVDPITLAVLRDSLDRAIAGFDADDNPVMTGSPFGLHDVLQLLSGYEPTKVEPMLNDYDQPIPDRFVYPGVLYSPDEVIRALIDEIQHLRGATST